MKKISLATRQKVIQLFKEETQIKEIAQILLNRENIKISYGSVWNIIESWRSSQSKSTEPVAEQPLLSEPNGHLVSFTPVLVQESPSVVGPSGCPLSRFIPQEEIPEIKDSGLGSLSIPQEKKANDQPTIKNTITNDPEEIDILDTDSEPDIYTDPNADYDEQYDGDPLNPLQRELDSNWQVTAVDILRAIRQGKNLDSIQQ